MVEPNAGVPPDRVLNGDPVAVAFLVCQAKKHNISFSAKILGFLNWVQGHLLDGSLVNRNLLFDQSWRVPYKVMVRFTLSQKFCNLLLICKFIQILVENLLVCCHIGTTFGAEVASDLIDLFLGEQLDGLDESLVIFPVPIAETSGEKKVLLDFLFF